MVGIKNVFREYLLHKKYTKKTFLLKNGVNHIIEIEGI